MNHYSGSVPGARRLDWMAHTACRDEREIFDDPRREHEARIVCVARCPVRAQCLAYTKETERGLHRDQRDGVAAGLTYDERHRLDDTATHRKDDGEPIVFTGFERCGTHLALLKHLWHDERIDSKCWSGEVYREHGNRATPAVKRPDAIAAIAPPAPSPPPQPAKPPVRGNTPKERHVYRLWSRGLPDLEIARRADLSTLAVRRIRDALGLIPNLHVRKAS